MQSSRAPGARASREATGWPLLCSGEGLRSGRDGDGLGVERDEVRAASVELLLLAVALVLEELGKPLDPLVRIVRGIVPDPFLGDRDQDVAVDDEGGRDVRELPESPADLVQLVLAAFVAASPREDSGQVGLTADLPCREVKREMRLHLRNPLIEKDYSASWCFF